MDTTAVKCLRALEWLCRHSGPAGVTEMALALDVSKSNAHRILRTLTTLGFAECPLPGSYEASLKTWEIGSAVLARADVKTVSHPVMLKLGASTGEAVHLSVLDGAEVVYIDKVESNQPVRAYSSIGGRAPAHAVATGKALLAFHPGDLKALLPRRLTVFTRHTVANQSDLAAAIDEIRRRGFAVNRGEWREDVCGIAAPIRNDRGDAIAALGLSGPRSRLTADRINRLSASVVEAADHISGRLGHRPAQHAAAPESADPPRPRARATRTRPAASALES
jgi:IclR family transcriptional regulator, KDG regulon repressor